MDQFQRYGNLLRNDGTNQLQRLSPALESDYILPDERTLSDLLTYARQLATEIRFFSLTGKPTGDWQPFLDAVVKDLETGEIHDPASLEALLQSRRDWPPHLALFVVFLQLFSYLQSDLNQLPQRHLRHYYEQELNLLRREAQADEVHVIFELARNAAPTLIAAGTLLDAGKDSEGRPLYYATQSDLVVNAAQVTDRFRLVGETDRRGFRQFFVAKEISELEGESWYTFGRKQLDLDPSQRFMTEAQIGFAIASPILLMAEGDRTLTIKAQLRSATDQQPVEQGLDSAFFVDLTGAEGWLQPDTVTATLQEERVEEGDQSVLKPVLTMTVTCSATAPAIVAFDPALHGDGPVADWPVIRCHLNTALGYYDILDGLIVESATLTVDVKGVKNLVVQNSQGVLSPDQPIPLFGTQPNLGAPFFVGSVEAFSKQLTSLTLHLEWQDLPENLSEYYQAYFDVNELSANFGNKFKFRVDILYSGKWKPLLPNQLLFNRVEPTKAEPSAFHRAFSGESYRPQPQLLVLSSYRSSTKYGFIRLVLEGPTKDDVEDVLPRGVESSFRAFGHRMFAERYATQAIALSQEQDVELPKEPLTPTLANFSLDYSTSVKIRPGAHDSQDTFFQITSFGYAVSSDSVAALLIPPLAEKATSTDAVSTFGILYIGLTGLTPPANISLLFQIDEGTANNVNGLMQSETEWSYLSRDIWTVLPRGAILNDSTYGFQQPGLIVLSVGHDATLNHTVMPSGRVWLRALIRQPPSSAARTLSLRSQSVKAIFSPPDNSVSDYGEHLQAELAAETIQRLKRRIAAIKTVHQLYPSFGGRDHESDLDFFRRGSERLRHRSRAITIWDFERLILEAFPEVFKVKCLPHTDADGNPQAGNVALVIVPDVRNLPRSNLLEPRAGAVLMNRIHDYVNTALATPFSQIHVVHPVYERVRVDARIAFRSGLDAGYYANILNQDLQRFLSPWAYTEGEDIVFGGQIYRSEILAYMEGRNYVDYITDFNLYHSHDGPARNGIGDMTIGSDFLIRPNPQPSISATQTGMIIGDTFVVGQGVEVAIATGTRSILVSHSEHRITPTTADEVQCSGVRALGIGYMTVGLDFDVAKTF